MPTAYDHETLDFYATSAEPYLASRPDSVSRHLPEFLAQLSPGASILELGCGGGRDAAAMMAAGFEVDPTDGVAEIAQLAAERLGSDARVMRFDQLDACETYDAVWANASLHHVPRHQLPAILQLIFTALKPGGLHFANYKAAGSDKAKDTRTPGRDSHARYYNYMSQTEMSDLYKTAADWQILSALDYMGGGGFESQVSPWVAITVRKPG